MSEGEEDVTTEPEDGVYIHGLFVECARWNKISKSLDEAVPKVLNEKMPMVRLVFVSISFPLSLGSLDLAPACY